MSFHDLSLDQLRDLAEMAASVGAAAEVDLFHRLREGPCSVEDLARDLELDRRAVEILLPVLEELRFVELREGKVLEGPRAREELWEADGSYRGKGLPLWLANLQA